MRFQLKMEVIVEYDADPKNYPDCNSPEEMIAVDVKNMEDEPTYMLAIADNDSPGESEKITITGKVLS